MTDPRRTARTSESYVRAQVAAAIAGDAKARQWLWDHADPATRARVRALFLARERGDIQ